MQDDRTEAKRAAIYTRVSTTRQAEEGYSLDEQERRALAHVERMGWTHAGTYREEGVSGAKVHRPELDRLLRDLDAIDVLVLPSLDRLGRSTRHLLELYEVLEDRDVSLVSLRESLDSTTPVGRLLRTVLSAVAEFERDLGRERTSAAIAGRAHTDAKPWGTPAYGWKVGDDGHWEPVPEEIEVRLRVMRERVERWLPYSTIARALNREGVKPRRGKAWSPTVIKRMIEGREPLGFFWHDGAWVRGRHEAIVNEATWKLAQAVSEDGRKYAPNRRSGVLPKAHLFVRGMLRCPRCREAMLPRSEGVGTYVCRGRKTWGTCDMPILKRAEVDGAALRMFEECALDVDATRAHVERQLDDRAQEAAVLLDRAERDLAEREAALDRYDRDYTSGKLSARSFERLSGRAASELDAARAERDRLAERAASIHGTLASLDAETEALRRLTNLRSTVAGRVLSAGSDVDALRAAIGTVFDRVVLVPERWLKDGERDAHVDEDGYLDWLWDRQPEVEPERYRVMALARPDMILADEALRRVAIAFDMGANRLTESGLAGHLFGSGIIDMKEATA